MAIGLWTGNDQGQSMAEDVRDLVENIDYEKTPFYSDIGTSEASNTLHSWLIDTYDASADNAVAEGSDVTHADITPPQRSSNIVQLMRKEVKITTTQMRVKHYGFNDPFTYQLNKKMKELARDAEKALIAGTRASGSSGVARRMDGAIALITTNKTTRASGTSLTEAEFNDIMQNIFDSGTDNSVDKVYCGATLKRAISGYTGGSTKFTDADGKQVYNTVSVYESDFGVHMVHLEREVPTGANAKGILCVDSAMWRKAYLTDGEPQHIPLAMTGSARKSMIEMELTLEALNEKSSAYRSGYV